jgi:hypothetical protein
LVNFSIELMLKKIGQSFFALLSGPSYAILCRSLEEQMTWNGLTRSGFTPWPWRTQRLRRSEALATPYIGSFGQYFSFGLPQPS